MTAARRGSTTAVEAVTRQERLGVAVAAALLLVWACWRTQFGADTGDGAHSVALAVRLADGAMPFVDETNTQATGSLLAVPFTWLWVAAFGTEGVVLASRLYFVALSALIGYLSFRVLRPSFRPAIAFVVPAVGLVPTTYNLMLVNYTTAPGLALVLATAAGHAAAVRHSRPWAATAGIAAVLAGFSDPATVPSAALLLLVITVLCRADRCWRWVVGGVVSAGVVAAVWLLAVVGAPHIVETVAYTVDYQSTRLTHGQRLDALWRIYGVGLASMTYLPMWGFALLACLRPIGHRVRAGLLLGVVVAAAVPSILLVTTTDTVPLPFGRFSGVFAAVASCGLLVPAVLAVARERDRRMSGLMMLAIPPALLSVPVVAALSSAGPYWGAAATGLAPAFGVLSAIPVWLVTKGSSAASPGIVLAAAVVPVLAVALVHTTVSFRDPAPWLQTAVVRHGAYSGVRGLPGRVHVVERVRLEVQRSTTPEDSVFVFGSPAAYLFVPGRINTNIVWTPLSGPANQFTIDFFARRDDFPDVVFLVGRPSDGGWWRDGMASQGPDGGLLLSSLREGPGRTRRALRRLPPIPMISPTGLDSAGGCCPSDGDTPANGSISVATKETMNAIHTPDAASATASLVAGSCSW